MVLRKTKLMLKVEEERGSPLEQCLPEMVNDIGFSRTAEAVGISKATLGYWLLKMGVVIRRIALRPGETIEVRKRL